MTIKGLLSWKENEENLFRIKIKQRLRKKGELYRQTKMTKRC